MSRYYSRNRYSSTGLLDRGRSYRSTFDWTPRSRTSLYYREPGCHFDIRDYRTIVELDTDIPEADKEVLRVQKVNFNIAENVKAHHTDKFEITDVMKGDKYMKSQLVVRRGQSFDIEVEFDREFSKEKDDLNLIFEIGKRPLVSKGTSITLTLSDADKPKQWGAKVKSKKDKEIVMTIFTPPDIPIGKWQFKIDSIFKDSDSKKKYRYTHEDPIYMLFNPWCPDDLVFLDDENLRREYVLNDSGKIYSGTAKNIRPKPWNFGQFEDFMLDCCFHLLEQSGLSYKVMGNPVNVSRKISAMTNAPDDGGVLVGNWSGKYAGGTSPLAWSGSVRILEEYWRTLQPVKYGQCWVFSGVVTSIARCLGIPARSVTNFSSAHDTDGSITIDNHWGTDGKPLEEYNSDSVWNFHVWNDVWMARPDLPTGFGGWQAIDATPQETSDGVFCAGPASLEALKNGLVNLPYDGAFIFAEVNADRVHWIHAPDGQTSKQLVKNQVGKSISTKLPIGQRLSGAIGGGDRQDITNQYKYPEKSHQERTAVWRAAQASSLPVDVYDIKDQDVFIDMIEKDDVLVGQPFDVVLKIKNKSAAERTVKATLTARVVHYTGVPAEIVKSESLNIKLEAAAEGKVEMKVDPSDYLGKLVDMCMIRMNLMASIIETKQVHCESDDFRLIKPDIDIKAPDAVNVAEEFSVEAKFINPLPTPLTNCEFTVEGPGLQKPVKVKIASVPSGAEAKLEAQKYTPRRPGDRKLIVSFHSTELSDMSNDVDIIVK
ncbi:unnamed protein product [Owenia fusiformis]|uniref:protein-glutamine gamma-glutamyltransferase n=1 Tax=Owenia fusiformis TaxID=6347 RepID=A0A8J1TSI2_OWEFU|nr:unnamed protein product [Owenia fusiformis]